MHRSRICTLNIDCENADVDEAARFWSQALGRPSRAPSGNYVGLEDRAGQPAVSVQRVTHTSGMHIDIETDDVEAEVQRLEALGARRVERVERNRWWWVMEAPTGHRFCVSLPKEARSARTRMSGIGSLRSSLSALSRSPGVRRSARSAGCARKTTHYRTDSTVRVGRRHRDRGVERRQLFGREGPADAPIFSLSCRSSRSRCLTRYRNRPCDTERRESRERHVPRTGRARRRRECTRSIPRSAHTRRSASQHHSTARRTAAGVAQCRLSLARTRGGCARGRPQSWWTGREIELGGQKRLTPERSRTTPGGSRSSPR
jgi:hypothetical protein